MAPPVVVLYAVSAVLAASVAQTLLPMDNSQTLEEPLNFQDVSVPIPEAELTISILLKQMHARKRVVIKELAQPQGCQEFVERVYWTCDKDELNELVIYKVLVSVNALQDLYCEEMSPALKDVIFAEGQQIFGNDTAIPTLILENDQAPNSTKEFCDMDFDAFGQCDQIQDWRLGAVCRFYSRNHVGFMFSLSDTVNGAAKQATSVISSNVKKAIRTLNKAVKNSAKEVEKSAGVVKETVVKLAEDTKTGAETAVKAGAGAVKDAANAVGSKVKTAVNGAVDGAVDSMKEEIDRIVEKYKLKWVAAALAVVLVGLILYWAYPFISACFAFLKCGWQCFTCVLPKVLWLIECCIERRKSKKAAKELKRRDFEVVLVEEDLYDQVAAEDDSNEADGDKKPGVWKVALEFLMLKRSKRHNEYLRSPSSNDIEHEAPSLNANATTHHVPARTHLHPNIRNSANFEQQAAISQQQTPCTKNTREQLTNQTPAPPLPSKPEAQYMNV